MLVFRHNWHHWQMSHRKLSQSFSLCSPALHGSALESNFPYTADIFSSFWNSGNEMKKYSLIKILLLGGFWVIGAGRAVHINLMTFDSIQLNIQLKFYTRTISLKRWTPFSSLWNINSLWSTSTQIQLRPLMFSQFTSAIKNSKSTNNRHR